MPQRRVFDNRSDKESFKRRRKALLGSAEILLQDGAQVFIVVRQLDTSYVYNSETSRGWLPSGQDKIRPLYQPRKESKDSSDDEQDESHIGSWNFPDPTSRPTMVGAGVDPYVSEQTSHAKEQPFSAFHEITAQYASQINMRDDPFVDRSLAEVINATPSNNNTSLAFTTPARAASVSRGLRSESPSQTSRFVHSKLLTPPKLRKPNERRRVRSIGGPSFNHQMGLKHRTYSNQDLLDTKIS